VTLEGTYTGTVDRITGGTAVCLVEDDGETVAERRVPVEDLPAGTAAGDVCSFTFDGGTLVGLEASPERTAERRRRLRERFEALSEPLDGTQEENG
jgi:hypothetical protein